MKDRRIAVVGLGYVGLPLAVRLAECAFDVIGFDKNEERVTQLRAGTDSTEEIESERLTACGMQFSTDAASIADCGFVIIAVPTPIDQNRQPDLRAMMSASRSVGAVMKPGTCVVYESTVYPGVTRDICRPILAEASGLKAGVDFTVGYSPERINPGDKEHTIDKIVKVVSGEDAATLERVSNVYGAIVTAGIHRAASIEVAEAAKVIENTQRDLNIALMNELAIIFDRLDIPTRDVLAAAATKWNFQNYKPGLVGGHCIGVDPYYLTARAEQTGYHPEVILAGRRINDNMGRHIAQRLIKAMLAKKLNLQEACVAVLGFTFKENVPDVRNTRVIDIIGELQEYGISVCVYDPVADSHHVEEEYGFQLQGIDDVKSVCGMILAVPHKEILQQMDTLLERLDPSGVIFDVKSALQASTLPGGLSYLAL